MTQVARGISEFRWHLGTRQRCISGYLELRSAVRIHGDDLLRARQDIAASMRGDTTCCKTVLIDGREGRDIPYTGVRRRIRRGGQLPGAPGDVLAGECCRRGRRAELARCGELKLSVLCGGNRGLNRDALQVTAAAAAQSRKREEQKGAARTPTKSAHAAPPKGFDACGMNSNLRQVVPNDVNSRPVLCPTKKLHKHTGGRRWASVENTRSLQSTLLRSG